MKCMEMGITQWCEIAKCLVDRTAKSVREHYLNQVRLSYGGSTGIGVLRRGVVYVCMCVCVCVCVCV